MLSFSVSEKLPKEHQNVFVFRIRSVEYGLIMMKLSAGSVCIKGNFRENNEDAMYVDQQLRFFVVADGMGGQNAGERASQMAVELIQDKLKTDLDFNASDAAQIHLVLDEAIKYANTQIMQLSELDPTCHNMGTTVVMMVAAGNALYVGGIGDSRIYRYHDGEIHQLTKDHTLTAALVEAGTISEEEAETHRYRHVLHRYLGSPTANQGLKSKVLAPEVGDRYLICSDGVTGGVDNDQLAELLKLHSDPQEAAEIVVQKAQEGGSKDNITCVVVDILEL